MKLAGAVVLITGANRGIGLAFAKRALARGAPKVYAAARDPATVALPGAVPMRLDVTAQAEIDAAVRACGDVTLVVNNAGIALFGGFLADDAVDEARRQLEVNFFGPLLVTRGFAPVLAANGGGAVINVLSTASWTSRPALAVYGATKTAAWGLTNGLRNDLRAHGTQVLGLHVGFVDTDLARGIDAPKSSPDVVADRTYDGLEAGAGEVLADDNTVRVRAGLSDDPAVYLLPPPA